jgi:regulator of protease activity HflC (stomatin/prohibitin superfamily)
MMADFNMSNRRVIDVNPRSIFRGLGLGIIILVVVILLFASITSVKSGHVGVLTLFGRVTGELLDEGIHMVNPFKINNEMSIRTQEIKESASVPSSEGLVMNLDTSLIFHLNKERAADVLSGNRFELYICID